MTSTTNIIIQGLLALTAVYLSSRMFFSKKWSPKGLHCYVTGGSDGLGLGTAIQLAKQGAHVTIVARTQSKLDAALEKVEAVRQSPTQIFTAHSFALDTSSESTKALEAACVAHGGNAPDAVFACAGSSKPMYFVEMDERDLSKGMVDGYWLQAWTAHAAATMMARQRRTGKIVLVSSTLGLMTFVGYASYSPAKQALRGLADTLQSELMLYGIDVHIFFAPTMYTAGYDAEMKTKPRITAKIEEPDAKDGLTGDQAATAMLKGVYNNQQHISANFITSWFKASTRGAVQRDNWVRDALYDMFSYVAIPIWRWTVDRQVRAHRAEHEAYLQGKMFYENESNK